MPTNAEDSRLTPLGNISLAPFRDVAGALFRDIPVTTYRVLQKRESVQTQGQFRKWIEKKDTELKRPFVSVHGMRYASAGPLT